MESRADDDAAAESPSPVARWVVFACADLRFGIPLAAVSEIVTPRPFTRLPGAGRSVCGLVGLRGRAVTVFDTGTVLGMRPAVTPPDYRLLLLESDRRRVALVVEEVVAIAPAQVEPPAAGPGGRLARAVLGTGRVDDATFVALDPWALITHLLN